MDFRMFPIDKLLKTLLLVAITTLPFFGYYYLHTEQQTDYLNQRNFRALNEIILQYQNNFKALRNLFKFPPPIDSKFIIYKLEDSAIKKLESVIHKLDEILQNKYIDNNSEGWSEWYGLQLDEIDSLKNLIIKSKTKIKTIPSPYLKELKKNISKKIEDIKTNHKHIANSQIMNQGKIDPLSDIINNLKEINTILGELPLKLDSEINDNASIINKYQYRLRLNESLGDISIKKIKEFAITGGHCSNKNNIKFSLDASSNPIIVKSFGCGYEYSTTLPALVGNIRHNEFDTVLLVNTKGKVLFSKSLKALHWNEEIDSHDQTNYTGFSVSNIKSILKKEDANTKLQNNENKPAPVIGISKKLHKTIGDKDYLLFIQPFKLNYSFIEESPKNKEKCVVTIIKVKNEKELRNKIKTFKSKFEFKLNQCEILIVKNQSNSPIITGFDNSGVLKSTEVLNKEDAGLINKPDDINKIIRLAAAYINPSYLIQPDNTYQTPEFYMIGLIDKTNFKKEILSIPVTLYAFVFILLLFGVLSWPTLKLYFIGIKEYISIGDIRFLVISLFITSGVVSIIFISILTIEFMEKNLDNENSVIAEQINTDFNVHIQKITKKFNEYKINPIKTTTKKQNSFPLRRDIFTVDEDGALIDELEFFVEDIFYSKNKLNIKNRDYFKETIKGNAWYTESENKLETGKIYLQRIHNYSDGIKSTQMAMPITQYEHEKNSTKPPRVLSSTTYIQSLIAPLLPYEFQYAIIENTSGNVLYHSQDDKAFAENFYSETEYNNELLAAIKFGKEYKKRLQNSSEEIQQSISGTYHAEQTNFHVMPLKTVPWTLVTFYPKKLAHVIAIQSGITTFIIFLFYCTLFFIVISISRKTKKLIKNNDTTTCAWLWPDRNKKYQYGFFLLSFLAYCLIYMLGVSYINGIDLLGYLVIAMITQLLLAYFILNGNLVYIKNSLKFKWAPLNCNFLFLSITLILILQTIGTEDQFSPKELFAIIIPIVAWVIINITLLRYSNKTPLFRYRTVYILMVSFTLLASSFITSYAIYKDSLSVYGSMNARQSQLEVANKVQQRHFKLDTFAKLFFPQTHSLSDGHTKCSTFNFIDKNTGIYGSNKTKLKLNIHEKPIDTSKCHKIPLHEPNQENKINLGFSNHFSQLFAGFYFYLSQQYTASLDHFIKNDWYFDKQDTLKFTTMGISGKQGHTITSQSIDLSTVFSTLFKPGNYSLSNQAKIYFYILFSLFLYWFYQRVSFIAHRVFCIDTPEIVKNKKIENLIADEIELKGQCLILINGVQKQIKEFCIEKTKTDNFSLEPLNTSNLGKFVSKFESKIDSNTIQNSTFIVIKDFIVAASNPIMRLQILNYLEYIQVKARSKNSNIFILLCVEIHPLRCLVKPELYTGTHMQHFAGIASHEEKYRWIKLLTKFLEYNDNTTLYSDSVNIQTSKKQRKILYQYIEQRIFSLSVKKARKFVFKNKDTHEVTKEEIIEYVGNHNYPYYRRLWSLCNIDERLMLYQLATDRFANPNNSGVIRSLYSRGYIVREPFFQIQDDSFKKFILAAEPVDTFQKWEKNADLSLWANIKVPLFITLIFLAGLFIYISTDALETTIALLTPLLAFVPLLFRSISTVQAANPIEKDPTTEENDS